MAKVTSKRQVTIPKAIADRYGIREGDDVEFSPAGDVICVVPAGASPYPVRSVSDRLELFDAATERQRLRDGERGAAEAPPPHRGWTREELYGRGRTD